MSKPTHEEMLEEDYQKVQKEVANKKAWEAVQKLYAVNGDALKELAEIETEERERMDAIRTAND